MLNRTLIRSLALAGALMVPAIASAAPAIATTNVNLRSGPSTAYPAVDVVRGGAAVEVHGCLSNRSWCDVTYRGYRGWMSSNYLAQTYRGTRYSGPRFVERVGPPVVSFSFGNYWDRHYQGRSFYRDRERYRSIHDGPRRGDWNRRDDRRPDWRERDDRRGESHRRDDDRRGGWDRRDDDRRGDNRGRDDRRWEDRRDR
ncbi:SH3 domain-containing protein [Aureimonas populi]|uniref:SH3 domain-containing protein n=1 Tax=Aureimonas populi TaxID=1701758 RepID=A0ABW5CN33_9HYPH|nr:SH3 domain-containing protein [Aureimonas populi]